MVKRSDENRAHELVELRKTSESDASDSSRKSQQHQLKGSDEENVTIGDANVDDEMDEDSDIRGDKQNLLLLTFLYLLQGIPLGLTSCIPMLLQKRGASYQTQAKFSIVWWPFNLKLLWAPIIDSLYSQRFGRRKSWLVPVQFLIGIFMLVTSFIIENLLGNKEQDANITVLGIVFFIMTMLGCTQDIIVDGWALTMLKRRNIGYASVCNNIGNPLGNILGYAVVISLESAEFCNRYLRSVPKDEGIITLSSYLQFWGIMFILVTALIAIFKKERDFHAESDIDHPKTVQDNIRHIWSAYKLAIKILTIPAVQTLAAVLFTVRIIWADYDGVAYLKFLKTGIDNEKMIPMLAFTYIPVQFFISLIAARFTSGRRPAKVFMISVPVRTVFALTGALIIWLTTKIIADDGVAPNYIYFVYLANSIMYSLVAFCMHVVLTAFFIKISDPSVGGTYMTILNTIDNLGWTWPHTVTLWLVDYLTWRECDAEDKNCRIIIDGYYLETAFCFLFGLFWYKWGIDKLKYLNRVPINEWRIVK